MYTQPAPWAGRPSGRPTEVNPLSGWPGRPGGRPAREPLLSGSGRVDRAVDRRLNGQKFDRWPVDRPVDRKVNFNLSASQRADFVMGYKYRI